MKRFINGDRIDFLDERYYYYGIDEAGKHIFLPSVTYVLDCYPKGIAFRQWLKDVGNEAKVIAQKAAESGSKVHDALERIANGEIISFEKEGYTDYEWKGLLNFIEFFRMFNPKIIKIETKILDNDLGVAGTADLICEIDGETWLIDYKFSNAVHTNYMIQISTYARIIENTLKIKIDRLGILHLKSLSRTLCKEKKQGRGWKLIEPTTFDKRFSREYLDTIFDCVYNIFKLENPKLQPKFETYPSEIHLDSNVEFYMNAKYGNGE